MFCMLKEKVCPVYVSKHNLNREQQVIILMIPNREGGKSIPEGRWYYLPVKKTIRIIKRNKIKK